MNQSRKSQPFLRKHSLSIAALTVVILLIVLYRWSNPSTHLGSFFGNAIADWTGVLVTIVMTKFLYEKGSAESKQPKGILPSKAVEFLREHSLTIFLIITGIGWIVAFRGMDPGSKWGQVVGNIVSEWTQILGLVLMTKRLIEVGSKEKSPDTHHK
jgi:membrane protease YdiL (CAAX protease family)